MRRKDIIDALVRFTLFSGTLPGNEWQECRVLPTKEAHRRGFWRNRWA
ncbi:hypothetical protein Q9L42_012425 [Methylomarinum sp. Ch1-1]|uniref:Uncharacterized protein n=1 Tax=Methylomarinum roseum TaxID=3067653 RepID=A0AAU7NQD2_9GAMM|nr:hypothetical protein [Methylomarinum sp. Ch1-1]MDP4520885.1 hypothetical protein [Methylomarinum sp. Ch1-1]